MSILGELAQLGLQVADLHRDDVTRRRVEAEVGELGQNVCVFHIGAERGRSWSRGSRKAPVICGKPPRCGRSMRSLQGARQAGSASGTITRLERR